MVGVGMEIVEVADRYRITLTGPVREVVPLKVGQKVAVIPFGDKILVKPLPDKPEEELAKLIGGVTFGRRAREMASKLLLSAAKRRNRGRKTGRVPRSGTE